MIPMDLQVAAGTPPLPRERIFRRRRRMVSIEVVAEKGSEATRLSGSLDFVGRVHAYDFISEVYVTSANQIGCAIIDYFE